MTRNATIVTKFSKLSYHDFKSKYLDHTKADIPVNSALRMKNLLASFGHESSVTYNLATSASVGNLSHYFKHPDWMAYSLHMIVDEGEEIITIIERDTNVLNSPKLDIGRVLAAHNEFGKLCYYVSIGF